MKDLIEYVAKSIVDHPEEVEVLEERTGSQVMLKLKVAQDDMGRVIGRQGRIVNSLRILVRVAAARQGARVSLEIV